jgi:hypothetical protein
MPAIAVALRVSQALPELGQLSGKPCQLDVRYDYRLARTW